MEQEELIARIAAEVLKRLTQRETKETPAAKGEALAVITGGTIGLEQGLAQLSALQETGVGLTVVLSPAAERVVGAARVRAALGESIRLVTAEQPFPGNALREAAFVVVPVLTQNTAAKTAQTISDGLAPTLLMQALLMGKPVIAASNAADPQDGWRIKAQMGKGAPALQNALRLNLKRLDEFGMTLTDVDELAAHCLRKMGQTVAQTGGQRKASERSGKRVVVDAAMIQAVAATGERLVRLAPGAIVTPLARDMARQHAIALMD